MVQVMFLIHRGLSYKLYNMLLSLEKVMGYVEKRRKMKVQGKKRMRKEKRRKLHEKRGKMP